MYINRIYIQNFRGFEKIEIPLNSGFTVAIGDNGMGKSSLLHALQVALGAYLQCLALPVSSVYRRQFKKQEKFARWSAEERDYVFNREETAIKVSAGFFTDENPIEWTRVMLANGTTSHNRKYAGQLIDAVRELLERRGHTKNVIFPVLASFGTERTVAQLRKGKQAQKRRSRMEKGYLAALSDKVDFDGVIEWLHNYNNELKYKKEFEGTREAVFEAISTAIPYLEDVGYNCHYKELEAVVSIDENDLGKKTHSNMSDGLIAMLNLVAELAFRCVVLNGFLGRNAVKESRGIVIIDELDMHLHPKWQRHIVKDLKSAFPKIQFVVTTHSPFIVQSLASNELINLDRLTDVALNSLNIDDVATSVMGVESAFSEENTGKHDTAKLILGKLKTGGSEAEIQAEIDNVSDPGLRAFLELNKLAVQK
jgi:predicted ATP-binding protein involved in virulence